MEAPKPITDKNKIGRIFEFSNEKNGKKYDWKIKIIDENIEVNIVDRTSIFNSSFQRIYSKSELEKMNKFFLMFDDMNSISLEIERRLKNNLYECFEDGKIFSISFKIEISNIKQIDLVLPLKENKDTNLLIQQLFNHIKAIEERVKFLEKENQQIKKENQQIKEELNLLKEKKKEKTGKNKSIFIRRIVLNIIPFCRSITTKFYIIFCFY